LDLRFHFVFSAWLILLYRIINFLSFWGQFWCSKLVSNSASLSGVVPSDLCCRNYSTKWRRNEMKILKQRHFLSSFCVKISSYVFIFCLSFFLLGDCCKLCTNYHLWISVDTNSFSEKFRWNDKSDLEDRDRLRQWIYFGDLVVFVSVFFSTN
jgi:hypothetical protein